MALPVTTAFVTATADLKAAQALAVDHIRSLGRRFRSRCDLKPFSCVAEFRYPANASRSTRGAIDTVLARAEIVLCLFGETLGVPLPEGFPFPRDFNPAGLPPGVVHPWPADASESELIPLSGPVFELLYARARRGGSADARAPRVIALFEGDGSRHPRLRALLAQLAEEGDDCADFVDSATLLTRLEEILSVPLGMAEAGAERGQAGANGEAGPPAGGEVAADLETATRKGELARVRGRIEARPEWLALPCSDGGSLLQVAVRHGHLGLVELFLQPRYAPWVVLDQRDSAGHHLLELALHLSDTRIAERLLERAPRLAGMVMSDGFTPLTFAVVNRRDNVVERMMRDDMAGWRRPADGCVVPMLSPRMLSPEALGQQLCVVLEDGAETFAGLPLMPARDLMRNHFAELRSRHLFGSLEPYDPAGLRCAALPFLPTVLLLLAHHASAGFSLPFLITQEGDVLLALREHSIYRLRLNRWRKTSGAELDSEQLMAYARFSCAISVATELGIRLVEDPSQVAWQPEATPAQREHFAARLLPLHLLAPRHEAPVIGATFVRMDQLFRGSIEIDPSMHLHITLDDCLIDRLPIINDTAELFMVRG